MEVPPAASGPSATVVWAVDARGNTPARSFFCGLEQHERAKTQALFNRLAEFGKITNKEQFKKLGTWNDVAIWEFKRFQIRFIGAFVPGTTGRTFAVAHGLCKKKDRHSESDIERAVRIIGEHVNRHRTR